ncbi:hypothetical protein [Nubsella zeaxanthinifaciens]|uniref:hypothetical protein n=1 Tax=Nubsella zeaxanthinifaciens TaxID=392412 RepID=UPI00130052C1|nr:hypothetical protein [Nubsella zeaxanthinifaciens]
MKRFLFYFFCLSSLSSVAQTLKPDVFIVGNGNAAAAAAIQSAQSNAKTVILLQAGGFDIEPIGADLHSGVQAKFLEKLKEQLNLADTIAEPSFDKQAANLALEYWANTLKTLTVIKNVQLLKADRAGKGWAFKLSDGRTIRPEVLVNIADKKLNEALKIDAATVGTWTKFDYGNTLYKTNVAVGKRVDGNTNSNYSFYQYFIPNQENLVYVSDPTSMLMGQAAGAIAAYAGFFDLKASQADLKRVQGELIAFNTNLMPFSDVGIKDANWKAIQMVGVTGMLKATVVNGKLLFNPEQLVSTAEIRQNMKDHYYKAQIWFDDYKSDVLTIGAALDLICYVGNKAPETTPKEVEKKWTSAYNFSSTFKKDRQITRRELAVLLQDYMPPFNITIDKTGKILR